MDQEGQGRDRRLEARDQQRHDLVADLPVGERIALLVARLDEQAEDVGASPPRARRSAISA